MAQITIKQTTFVRPKGKDSVFYLANLKHKKRLGQKTIESQYK